MDLKAKETVDLSASLFLSVIVVATLGWLLLLFLISTDEHGPVKILIEVAIEGLKVVVIGAAAAIVLERFLQRNRADNPEALLDRIGIDAAFASRRDEDAATEFLRIVSDSTVKQITIAGISLRDFLFSNGTLHRIWSAIQIRLEQENRANMQPQQRLSIRLLLIEPRSNEGCFRHEVEGYSKAAPGSGIPFDVPQGVSMVAAAQHRIYGTTGVDFLQVRLYEHSPFAFLFAAETSVLVEQYDYRDQTKDASLPLFRYKRGTRQFEELSHSIDLVWKHAREAELINEVGTATAIREARLRSIFRRDDRSNLSKRQADTLGLTEPGGLIRILAITGKFYTSHPGVAPLLQQISMPAAIRHHQSHVELAPHPESRAVSEVKTTGTAGTQLQIAIVNPTSQQAILRAVADESPAQGVRACLQGWNWTKHQEASLYRDVMRTGLQVERWRAEGSQIDLRLYSSSIACSVLLLDKTAFIEQYMYGRSKIFQPGLALGGEYPVIEFEGAEPDGRETIEREIIEQTFDIVWGSYSIKWEEYIDRDRSMEFHRNLVRLLEELTSKDSGPIGEA